MNSSIKAVAPALGVRVRVDAGSYSVHATDEGGRGYPWAAIFVPVAESAGHYGVRVKDKVEETCRPDQLYVGQRWQRVNQQGGSYFLTVPTADWPAETDVLLLLLYFQCRLEKGQEYREEVCDAVHATLRSKKVDELRGGVIRQLPKPNELPDVSRSNKQATSSLVTFALASCQYPADILDHMPGDKKDKSGPADASMLQLGSLLDAKADTQKPSLLVLAGDQVYVDATAGLFDPKARDDKYRIPYEQWLGSRGAQAVFGRLNLDVRMMLDDHEISDNWEPPVGKNARSKECEALAQGRKAYWEFQRQEADADKKPLNEPLWQVFEHRGLPFFLADTRTEREARGVADWTGKRIMSKRQFTSLTLWLVSQANHALPKFVVTPSALLPRRLATSRDPLAALHSDAWDGYPRCLHGLLAVLCDQHVENAFFLSGDEHLSFVVKAEVKNLLTCKQTVIHSIHSSALYAPYPFANGRKENFDCSETFRFPDPKTGDYQCTVTSFFPEIGDGFALLTARKEDSKWKLDVAFHHASLKGSHDASRLKQPGQITLPR